MSNGSTRWNHGKRSKRTRSRSSLFVVVGGLLVAALGAVWLSSGGGRPAGVAPGSDPVAVPGGVREPQSAAGVLVAMPAVDRGVLPLNKTVSQSYELVNTGGGTAELGRPTIEVLDGCCPPQLKLSHATLAPGESATLSFDTQMHPGMDGPHLFHLTVPVRSAEGTDLLHFYFKGDFQG